MSRVRNKAAVALGLPAMAVICAAHPVFSSLMAPEAVSEYREAVREAQRGHRPMAQAIMEGLLLDRPVRIALVPGDAPSSCANEYIGGVQRGIGAWSEVLGDSPFQLARPSEHADLTLQFVARIPQGGDTRGGDTQGTVNVRRHYTWTASSHDYRITGRILIRDVAFGRRLTGEEIGRVLSHELGHVLGLRDDYDGPGVMSAFRDGGGPSVPSRDETRAVADFRSRLKNELRQEQTF